MNPKVLRELRRDLASVLIRQSDELGPVAVEFVLARKLLMVLDELCAADNSSRD